MKHEIVADEQGLRDLCNRVTTVDRVAIDTEFHNERSYTPRLMALQILLEDEVAIVDALALRDLSSLVDALCKPVIVGHALQSDLKIFADKYDRVPPRIFDTQVAAAFCGYGLSVSLADLVRDLTDVRLKKMHTVSDWSTRPFSAGQIQYLVDDVAHLFELHDKLQERLQQSGRLEWALEESQILADIERYRPDPRRMYLRIPGAMRMNRRELGILSELVTLREGIARTRDVPLKFVLPDDVLAGLATLRPKTMDDLAHLRRLDGSARKALGEKILNAVARCETILDADLPEKPSRPLGSGREGLVAVMNVVVTSIAQENDLPASLLVPRSALERVARELPSSSSDLVAVLDLSNWRLELVAPALWRLLSAQSAVRIEGYASGEPRITVS